MKIVVTEPEEMGENVRQTLEGLGQVIWGPFDENGFQNSLTDCEILMVRLGRYIDESMMQRADRLRCIVTATTGLNHIDLEAAAKRQIRVISLRDCMDKIQDVSATAEHTWGLLLGLLRNTVDAMSHVLDDGWDRNRFWGSQLRGKRLGIIGYGRIGSMVAGYGQAFDMEVMAYDIDMDKVSPPVKAVSLEELVSQCDIISIHATGIPENQGLIDGRLVAKMKSGAIVINTARGLLADSTALANAVVEKCLAGVAVDVIEGEEYGRVSDDPLLQAAKAGHNVLITPHIGGATREAIARTEGAVVDLLETYLNPNISQRRTSIVK